MNVDRFVRPIVIVRMFVTIIVFWTVGVKENVLVIVLLIVGVKENVLGIVLRFVLEMLIVVIIA
jgi:hypothetical protein